MSLLVHFKQKFNYEQYRCNGCHDLMQKAMNFNDAAIVFIKGSDYRIHFWYMSKDDEIKIINYDKSGLLQIFILLYMKMCEKSYYQRNGNVMLNTAKEHYKNDKKG